MATNTNNQNKQVATMLRNVVDIGIDRTFEDTILKTRNGIQNFVNKELSKFFAVMFKDGTINTASGVAPDFVSEYGKSWLPLNVQYLIRKNHKPHYEYSGSLRKAFPSTLYGQSNRITRIFGGLSYGSVVKTGRSKWTKKGTKKASWSYNVFDKVHLNKMRAEMLLDKFMPPQQSTGKNGKTRTVNVSTKFGIHRGKITGYHTRPFLYQAIKHFQKNDIERAILRKYPITITRGRK